MYAQEATRLPLLLVTVGQILITIVLPGNVRRLGWTELENKDSALCNLQKSLNPLGKVTLQIGGLDLFMEQGGICSTLGKECCFYMDHYGIVTRTIPDELRKDIDSFKPRTPMRHGLIGPHSLSHSSSP